MNKPIKLLELQESFSTVCPHKSCTQKFPAQNYSTDEDTDKRNLKIKTYRAFYLVERTRKSTQNADTFRYNQNVRVRALSPIFGPLHFCE